MDFGRHLLTSAQQPRRPSNLHSTRPQPSICQQLCTPLCYCSMHPLAPDCRRFQCPVEKHRLLHHQYLLGSMRRDVPGSHEKVYASRLRLCSCSPGFLRHLGPDARAFHQDLLRESQGPVFGLFATPETNILYMYWADPAINPHWIPGIRDDDPAPSYSQFPQVESMKLSSPAWYPGVAPRLKSLDLRIDNSTASLNSLLCTLEDCPVLEFLTLQGYHQFVDEDSPDVSVAALPNLHRLHLFSCNSVPILASLHLPSLTHPLVIFDSNPRGTILPHLQRHHDTLYLKGVSKLRVELNMGNSHYSVSVYHDDGRMNLFLGISTVSHLPRERWIHESMEAIMSFSPFSKATSLSITADVDFSSLSPGLSGMRCISRVDLCCPDATGYLDSLSTLVDGLPPCPSLNTLGFQRFRRSCKFDCRSLKACILFRRVAGCPLNSIIIPGCDWA